MASIKKDILLAAGATSTSTQNSASAHVTDSSLVTLHVRWTPGAASNVLTLKLQFTSDETSVSDASASWAQEGAWTLAGGHKTFAIYDLQETASGTDPVNRYYHVPTALAKRLRVVYDETVSAGTLTLHLLHSGD